jgi:hypothetical protein
MGKRANGEGNVYQRSNGSWEARMTYVDPETGRRRLSFYAKTAKAARGPSPGRRTPTVCPAIRCARRGWTRWPDASAWRTWADSGERLRVGVRVGVWDGKRHPPNLRKVPLTCVGLTGFEPATP